LVEIRLLIFRFALPRADNVDDLRSIHSSEKRGYCNIDALFTHLGLPAIRYEACRVSMWTRGSINPLLLNRQLHEEAMGVLYGENTFQFRIWGRKLYFAHIIELESSPLDIDGLDDQVKTRLREPNPENVLFHHESWDRPSSHTIQLRVNGTLFYAVRMLPDGHVNRVLFRFLMLEMDLISLPRDGLRRIGHINLALRLASDLQVTKKVLQDASRSIGSGQIRKLSLTINMRWLPKYTAQGWLSGDELLEHLRQLNARKVSVTSFVPWNRLETPVEEWARGLPPAVPSVEPCLTWGEERNKGREEWRLRVNKAWAAYLEKEIMRPVKPRVLTGNDGEGCFDRDGGTGPSSVADSVNSQVWSF
jgi:hypothetical protein